MRSYCGHPAALKRAASPSPDVVRDLQKDLKSLGYHGGEISGAWGSWLDKAIAALRFDLTHPAAAPALAAHNVGGAVLAAPATGATALEPALATVIAALCDDPGFRKLPSSADPLGDNHRAWSTVTALRTGQAPTPFLAAIFKQESGGRHYSVPTAGNADAFIVLGLDHNDATAPERITSRGYGMGQYTLFHHPPTAAELSGVIADPALNVRAAFTELRTKFDHEVYSPRPGQGADDRMAEHPLTPLRLCKYAAGDARYLADCRACAAAARKVDVRPGRPVFPGSTTVWATTTYYSTVNYPGVPDRADFPCDWPYAVRRYNGGGINSYHYQARILTNLLYAI
jgi:hypothetical protein